MSVFNWHLLKPKDCLRYAQWHEAVLFCPVCQRELALRYKFGEEVRVYVHKRYERFKNAIEAREDLREIASERDLLGEINFTDWGDFLHDFQSGENAVLPVRESRGWFQEDCEGYNSCEIRCTDLSCGGKEDSEETKEDTKVNLEG